MKVKSRTTGDARRGESQLRKENVQVKKLNGTGGRRDDAESKEKGKR